MMGRKHLHELLQEDQEPFVLKKYIADRRCELKKPSPKTHLQIKKRKPITQTSSFPSNFCKNACFFSTKTTTDFTKSPLFEFPSPVKRSPCKSPNAIFLHIPARTAAILLEAALRIQKQSKTKNNGGSSGLFGSILKRITHRNKSRNSEISNVEGAEVSVKDILRWDSSVGKNNQSGRPSSSAVWSETNEEKSMDLDLDTSCSCSQSEDFEEIFVTKDGLRSNAAFGSCDEHFCESPFHFVLQKSPSFTHRTPLFSSPTTSPSRRQKEDKENYQVENFKKLQVEEEEEEQCSPVSVLDPPFEDDDDRHVNDDNDDDNDDEKDGFDLECSYANVQSTFSNLLNVVCLPGAKQQLLHKLRRFEKLAELDPIELEKRMLEDDDDGNEEEEVENESVYSDGEIKIDVIIQQVLKSSFQNPECVPDCMKRLVSDLITEEEAEADSDLETVAKRVCKRIISWKDVESNTIDMMVDQDFKRLEVDGWKRNEEQIKEIGSQLEYAIFGLLMEELSEELVCLNGI
ncbi:zinc-regulated protein 8-like [Gossypium australe]|uniref:Zinc-regulated protein 8-like n=1 Tax=Gossypium australe TaxID=47621 RepID=A0A5B6V752_9ROSI|nr:zinc-regulated protein 8-like [Gossypium australe]